MSNIQRYEPWSLLNQIQNDLNCVFPELLSRSNRQMGESNVETSQWAPRVDIKEEPSRFVVFADIPGVSPENFEITMENQTLSIKGEKIVDKAEQKESYSRKERFEGRFYRQFTLPETADGEHITAQCHKGVLEISIPKKEPHKARKIEVMSKD